MVSDALRIAVLSPIRLIGEGVAACLRASGAGFDLLLVRDLGQLRAAMAEALPPSLAIVDVTQTPVLAEIRDFHSDWPDLPLLALGLREREAEIIAHGSAGFIGYLPRDDGLEQLRARIEDALSGRLLCSPELAAGIMRGLFRGPAPAGHAACLTPREKQVAGLVGRGCSNKEIARALALSESTVKHHVHSILAKRGVGSRIQLARDGRGSAWDMTTAQHARG